MEKIKYKEILVGRKEKVTKGGALVLSYHPLLKPVSTVLHKHLYLLYIDKEVKRLFTPEPIVSFTTNKN